MMEFISAHAYELITIASLAFGMAASVAYMAKKKELGDSLKEIEQGLTKFKDANKK